MTRRYFQIPRRKLLGMTWERLGVSMGHRVGHTRIALTDPGNAASYTVPGPSARMASWVLGMISTWPTRFC
jgi:hypothetical protein